MKNKGYVEEVGIFSVTMVSPKGNGGCGGTRVNGKPRQTVGLKFAGRDSSVESWWTPGFVNRQARR